MAGALRRTMLYLGLTEDQENEGTEAVEESYDYSRPQEPLESAVPEKNRAAVTPLRPELSAAPAEDGLRRIVTVHPTAYNDALVIGEAFRSGTPVIMNLSNLDDANAKRLVDFAAGLTFGLHGSIDRVTNKVFLLSPANVEVAAEDRSMMPQGPTGLYTQG